MRKRQFGYKTKIYSSDHNLAQTYIEQNIREISMDGFIRGIISGGTFTPHSTLEHTIILASLVARSYYGERISVDSPTNINMKPSVDPGAGYEVWVTAYAEYDYQLGELDTDGDGVSYYKDYQNSFSISTIQGVVNTPGNAVKPTIPTNAVLLCDIRYNSTLYASGVITPSDINTDRQDRYDSQAIVNLNVTGTSTFAGDATFNGDVDLQGNSLSNVADPTDGSGVGDRDYYDTRYLPFTGGTLTGALTVPDITVTASLAINDLTVNGTLEVDENVVVTDSLTVQDGNFSVNVGDASIGSAIGGGSLICYDSVTAKALIFPWMTSTGYVVGEVVYYEDGIYKCVTGHTASANFVDDITNWESIGGGGGTTHRVTMTAHGFIPGDVLRWDSSVDPNGYVKALADDVYTLGQFVVIRVLDVDNFLISQGGYFEDLTFTVGFTANTWYYTSDTVAGQLTATEPQISNPMVYAISANEGFVFPFRPNVGATLHLDEYTATAGQTVFTMSKVPYHSDYMIVSVDGVIQSTLAYNWSGTTLTFTSPLLGGEEVRIQLIHNILGNPGATMLSDEFTVTSTGETEFTLTETPVSNDYLIVSVDGVVQHSAAYTVVGTTLTFSEGLTAGNEIRAQQIKNLNVIEPADFTLSVMDIYKVSPTIDRGIQLATNGLSSGPIEITDGNIVEIPDGYTWTIV